MTKKAKMLDSLRGLEFEFSNEGLVRTESMVSALIADLSKSKPLTISAETQISDILASFVIEVASKYPLHALAIKDLSDEFEKASRRGPELNPRERWDSLEDRCSFDTGNLIIEKANQTKDSVARTLLLLLNIVVVFETGSANFGNFLNSVLKNYSKALDQESEPLLNAVLTLDPKHKKNEIELLGREGFRCEIKRIRNGIAHSRFDVNPDDGSFRVWDVTYVKSEGIRKRVFDRTYKFEQLLGISNAITVRLQLLDAFAYLATLKGVMAGPKASEYLVG